MEDLQDPLFTFNPTCWQRGLHHTIRRYKPDQRLHVVLDADACVVWVYYGTQALRHVLLSRCPSGTFLPVSYMCDGSVEPFPYSVAVLFDDAGRLDAEMKAAGLRLIEDPPVMFASAPLRA